MKRQFLGIVLLVASTLAGAQNCVVNPGACQPKPDPSTCPGGSHWVTTGTGIAHRVLDDPPCAGTVAHDVNGNPLYCETTGARTTSCPSGYSGSKDQERWVRTALDGTVTYGSWSTTYDACEKDPPPPSATPSSGGGSDSGSTAASNGSGSTGGSGTGSGSTPTDNGGTGGGSNPDPGTVPSGGVPGQPPPPPPPVSCPGESMVNIGTKYSGWDADWICLYHRVWYSVENNQCVRHEDSDVYESGVAPSGGGGGTNAGC